MDVCLKLINYCLVTIDCLLNAGGQLCMLVCVLVCLYVRVSSRGCASSRLVVEVVVVVVLVGPAVESGI